MAGEQFRGQHVNEGLAADEVGRFHRRKIESEGAATLQRLGHIDGLHEAVANFDAGKTVGQRLHVQLLAQGRSEEHTSELQSLMRISYAVFCLKKKKNTQQNKRKVTDKLTL